MPRREKRFVVVYAEGKTVFRETRYHRRDAESLFEVVAVDHKAVTMSNSSSGETLAMSLGCRAYVSAARAADVKR